MNGVMTERALNGTLQHSDPKATNLQCLLVEQKYKEAIKRKLQQQNKPDRERFTRDRL